MGVLVLLLFFSSTLVNPVKETLVERPDGKRNEPCDCHRGQCAGSPVSSEECGRRSGQR